MPTAAGELYLAGEGISEGYIGRPELTAEMFFPDIYFPEQKMYKSGDMGRLRADGRIEFLGRRDGQVKINGQRVELDEIINGILESGAASQAAVVPLEKPDGSTELIAFYVGEGGEDREETIREWLRSSLTEVMVPGRFCRVDSLPATPNGKVDVRLLRKLWNEKKEQLEVRKAPCLLKRSRKTGGLRRCRMLRGTGWRTGFFGSGR